MAAQPTGEATQQLWDDTLRRLLNLSSATVQRNTDLESRVAELEVELSVWKQAHAVALEATEREAKAHNVRIAALNRQIANLDGFKSYNPLILCIINGDENIFIGKLLTQGYQGGRTAAQQLTQAIAEYLANEDTSWKYWSGMAFAPKNSLRHFLPGLINRLLGFRWSMWVVTEMLSSQK